MTYTPVLPPYPHQVEAAQRMAAQPKEFALLCGMRTGKTKMMLDDWGRRVDAGEVADLLLIAPGGALYGEDALETQVPQHVPPEILDRANVVVWRSGAGIRARREAGRILQKLDPKRPRILMMNVEALSTVEDARRLCSEFLEPRNRHAYMAVDEATTIKGASKRTEAVIRLGEWAQYRRIMTGLVAPHSPLDLYYQFNFLNPKILGHHSWFGFRARHAIMREMDFGGRRKVKVVVAYRNVEELTEKIAPYSYRKELRDYREAPPPVYRFRDVEMTDQQRRIYQELRLDATSKIEAEDYVTTDSVMLQILRLHQLVCGYVVDEQRVIHDVPERRTAALLELLGECSGKAVIWCSYDYNVRKLRERLKKEYGETSVAAFWGGNRTTREEEERRFKGDPDCRFMLATAAAGGRGREWSCADLTVYYSNSPNLEHRDQSEMRTESVAKVDPVTRFDLRCPGTVDDKIIKNLRGKIDTASTLQGDAYREWLV